MTIEKILIWLVIGFTGLLLTLLLTVMVVELYVCFPYFLKPISEAPLMCIGGRGGIILTIK